MKILRRFTLRGPNYWSRRPAIEVWVDLEELKDSPSNTIAGLYERLTEWIPSLIEHRCGIGERGGFLLRLREGTWPAHILEHVALELQTLAGSPVGFGKARETRTEGIYRVAVRYQEESLGHASIDAGLALLLAAIANKPFDVKTAVARLQEQCEAIALGPSTSAIVSAAAARGIPQQRLNDGSLVQLGYGKKLRRVWTAETDRTSAIGEWIAQDKELTKRLLAEVGVPVPAGRPVSSAEDAWAAAIDIGLPVVVKPRDGNHGRAVFTDLVTQVQVETAFSHAIEEGSGVIVESFVPGNEHRLLVVGDRVVAAAKGETAWIVGDGSLSVRALVDSQLNSDPRRGLSDECPLSPIEIDAIAALDLAHQNLTPESVPVAGQRVLIQRNGNLAHEVTDLVHPEVAALGVLAARTVGLDICGIDLVTADIARSLDETGGAFVEVNASPGLHAHLKPATGAARPIGEAILQTLFKDGDDGRIPLVAIGGSTGKSAVAELVRRILQAGGVIVGAATSDGLRVGDRVLDKKGGTTAEATRRLLLNQGVQAAVCEVDEGVLLSSGLAYDKAQVAVVMHMQDPDHMGAHYIDTMEQAYAVYRCPVDVVLATGTAVLNAADAWVVKMAELAAGSVSYFALSPENPVLRAHVEKGGRAVTVISGQVVVLAGAEQCEVVAVRALPYLESAAFLLEDTLAAVAAADALGCTPQHIAATLQRLASLPGRFEIFYDRIVLDNAHSAHTLQALIAALDARFPGAARRIVYSAGAERRDADLARQGALLSASFDAVSFYRDSSCERTLAALQAAFMQGFVFAPRAHTVRAAESFKEAIVEQLSTFADGEILVVQCEESHVLQSRDVLCSLLLSMNLPNRVVG